MLSHDADDGCKRFCVSLPFPELVSISFSLPSFDDDSEGKFKFTSLSRCCLRFTVVDVDT